MLGMKRRCAESIGRTPPWGWASAFALPLLLVACSKSAELSKAKAAEHARALAKIAEADVAEVRTGLPEGAKHLAQRYADANPADDPEQARLALEKARNAVQDLRVAKSTFFALATNDGNTIRTDQEQDLMAGKNLFVPFPELRKASAGAHVETRGSMPEAARVNGRPDAQWVCAEAIKQGDKVQALYVTGWSWSAYAYRLENALRGNVKSASGEQAKMPLLYVYVIVDSAVYGAPISPEVNAQAIRNQAPLGKLGPDDSFAGQLEITDRDFGLGVQRAPTLGPKIAIAVLRSET
jgi:hypothetical protein